MITRNSTIREGESERRQFITQYISWTRHYGGQGMDRMMNATMTYDIARYVNKLIIRNTE